MMNMSVLDSKILSVVIPSYNMEMYLDKCIESLCIDESDLKNELEIIIINDGSKDSTSSIAHEYESKMPGSVKVIDKPNGHYGSCINEGLRIASGKYFRILDADDWFDKSNLAVFLKALETINSDVVFTKHTIHYEDDNRSETLNYEGMKYGVMLDLDKFVIPKECLRMHCLTYRTDFLRDISYHQTEGVCYTDNEYVVHPLLKAKSMWGCDLSLYQYRIGRGEQSVSITSMIKNVDHYLAVLKRLNQLKSSDVNRDITIRSAVIFRLLRIVLDVFVRFKESNKEQTSIIKSILSDLNTDYSRDINQLKNHKIKGLPLYRFWLNNTKVYYLLIYPLIKNRKK